LPFWIYRVKLLEKRAQEREQKQIPPLRRRWRSGSGRNDKRFLRRGLQVAPFALGVGGIGGGDESRFPSASSGQALTRASRAFGMTRVGGAAYWLLPGSVGMTKMWG